MKSQSWWKYLASRARSSLTKRNVRPRQGRGQPRQGEGVCIRLCRDCMARSRLLRHMRGQRMVAGIAEEGGLFGRGLQELLVLAIDVVAELDGLVLGHPCREIDP